MVQSLFWMSPKFRLKSLRIRVLFYQNFAMATVAISLFGCYLILQSGTHLFVIPVFCMKVVTNVLIGCIFHFFRRNQLYFFHNLGISTLHLYFSAMVIDLTAWLAVTLVTFAAL